MALTNPIQSEYLAIVGEWQGGQGRVGKAFPLLDLTNLRVVSDPLDEFPNPGAVFLPTRAGLKTWDLVSLWPRENAQYDNSDHHQCYYIPNGRPEVLNNPNQLENVAVILDHPKFDLNAANRQILNPRHNVTPIFFVQKGQSLFGPLIRDLTHLGPMEDVVRLDWRPAREDGIVYEASREELRQQGIRFVECPRPAEFQTRILTNAIQLALGDVRHVTSSTPRDGLAEASLIEWYLQRCSLLDIPSQHLAAWKRAFHGRPAENSEVLAARLQKLEREMATHAAFHEQRERFAKLYLESEPGQRRISELVEQTVDRKASEIQAEVDRRQSELARKREELARQFTLAELEHARLLQGLERQRDAVLEQVNELRTAVGELQTSLASDVRQLAKRMQEQLPLFAALTAGRIEPGTPVQVVTSNGAPPVVRPKEEFRPIQPGIPLRPIETESKLVDDLHAELARRGLHFARDFVGNVYTCLKAEPLNLIIGPPGYGKSMLVSALARSLGHGDAFLRITVQRSWSEDRYLLGFFDSFHGRYDPGPTGLVPRMLQAQVDWRQGGNGIYLVLLDEFNLAAPEYYFSQLLQALPSDDPVREVVLYDGGRLGGEGFPDRVTLGPNLRFWGTINYDETTERLSPRTLDRTGMIFLGDADVKASPEEEHAPMPGVAATDLFGKFWRDPSECPDDRWEIVSQVIDFLRSTEAALGMRIELSPRVKRAIRRYLANSVDVLSARVAVDFVVQQRILPVVRGRGDEFVARMRRLGQLLSDANLSRSAQHVEQTLRWSEQQFGEIDFLSY
jgi:hypothetical protein